VFVEAAQHGTTLVYEAGRAGIPIGKLEADADKFTRALPASARANAGRLWFPSVGDAPWVSDWIDEHAAFPNAAHDDTVDVTAYAARVAAAHWLPMESPREGAPPAPRPRFRST
jgi:predicted phage terminase large subunit-like protein